LCALWWSATDRIGGVTGQPHEVGLFLVGQPQRPSQRETDPRGRLRDTSFQPDHVLDRDASWTADPDAKADLARTTG
jgi:hypothetical protein